MQYSGKGWRVANPLPAVFSRLLQLADYTAGISNRSIAVRQDAADLRDKYLISKEVTREVWPK